MHGRALLLVVTLASPALAESAAGDPIDNLVPAADRQIVDASAGAAPATPADPAPPPWPREESPREERLAPPAPLGLSDLIGPMLKTFLMLGVVLAIAYLSLHKGLGKLVEKQNAGRRVKVVERVGLDQKRSLYIVEVDGQQMLLGGSDQGLAHLKDLTTPIAHAEHRPFGGFAARFVDAIDRRKDGKSPPSVSVPRAPDSTVTPAEGAQS